MEGKTARCEVGAYRRGRNEKHVRPLIRGPRVKRQSLPAHRLWFSFLPQLLRFRRSRLIRVRVLFDMVADEAAPATHQDQDCDDASAAAPALQSKAQKTVGTLPCP